MTLDKQITSSDIQQIAGREELVGFFAALGYDTAARIEQKPQHLGISADSTKKQITRIEKIADHDGFLQIYLFEVKSVTLAITRTLTNHFRDKAGNYLLILTSDYEFIDFVLLERSVPSGDKKGQIGVALPVVRPRIFSIERRKPTRKDLRVLRRFTYTEIDGLGQYEKLLNAYAVLDWSEDFFNNRALFSDYYLLERLRDHPFWSARSDDAYRKFEGLYSNRASHWREKKEIHVRQELFEPAFQALGFQFMENKSSTDDGLKADYLLFKDGGRDKPLTACLAYPWARSLDGKDYIRDTETPDENPGAVVVTLLESEQFDWIVVTNGKLWRLYSAKAHSRATNYYEIDLEEVIAQSDPVESFKYFWLLFRREAFDNDPESAESRTFLDSLLQGSKDYAKVLEDRLKARVFDDIFPHFAEGFIANLCASRACKASDLPAEELDAVYQGTLTFLYRLLFLLYAESRGLLPVNEYRGYYQKSLTFLKKTVADAAGASLDAAPQALKKKYTADSTAIYDELRDLFKIIDRGDKELNVPMYNGGLFLTDVPEGDVSGEAVNARFLDRHKIPDRFLALGLDRLARDEDPKKFIMVFVDYKSLGVRQLGSIYEGLLEFKLRVAEGKMAVVKGKKTEEIVPYQEAVKNDLKILTVGKGKERTERTYSKNDVFLANDKSERKATGSYYTPDYIVKYIVKHAVGPVLEEKFEAVRKSLRKVELDQKAFRDKQKALIHAKIKPEPESKIKLIGREVVGELFNLKVLDPAMGSGHFLVEAVDFITDKMIDFLNGFLNNPVVYHIEETRETILDEMKKQGIDIDKGRLTDLNLLKRHVLKRCIYGVDLNPMAVELAKVSLWLDCFTLGAPLSFLDHHLKCGNSLIGVSVKEVRDEIEAKGIGDLRAQMGLFGSRFAGLMLATDLMKHVGELSDVTADQVKESRKEYYKASDALAPFKRILDVYTSQWFGNGSEKKKKNAISPAVEFLKSEHIDKFIGSKDVEKALAKLPDHERGIAETALTASTDKRFFHWELEFPEVFYGPRDGTQQVVERLEGAGFDAVVGNPPYVRQEGLVDLKFYLASLFRDVYNSIADIYVYFYDRGYEVLRNAGCFGMITSNKFMRSNYGIELRQFLIQKTNVLDIIDFGDLPVFEGASTYPCIFFLNKSTSKKKINVCKVEHLNFDDLGKYVVENSYNIYRETLESGGWSMANNASQNLLNKIKSKGIMLGKFISEKSYCGVKTGLDSAFIIDEETRNNLILEDRKSAEVIKPYLAGKDVKRYQQPKPKRFLIFFPKGWTIAKTNEKMAWDYLSKEYPAIAKYLVQFKSLAEKRYDKGDFWWELRSCDYYEEFEKPKIIYLKFQVKPAFTIDEHKCYSNTAVWVFQKADKYLLGILNSKLGWFLISKYCTNIQGGFQLIYKYIRDIPIYKPNFSDSADKSNHDRMVELVNSMLELNKLLDSTQSEHKQDTIKHQICATDAEIDQLVYKLYSLTDDEIAIVEGRN